MDSEVNKPPITKEEQVRLGIESNLPPQAKGLIMEVKLGLDSKGTEETIVSVCSWHNPKQTLKLFQESLPSGVLISHGMCQTCTQTLEKDFA